MKLSVIEIAVLNLIPKGMERKITSTEIERLIDLNKRDVQAVVLRLIKKGVPLVAIRNGPAKERGYFIATNEEERKQGLIALKNQKKEMELRIKLVEQVNLESWENELDLLNI